MIEEHTTPSTGSLGTPTWSSVRGADTRGVTSRVRHFFLAPVDNNNNNNNIKIYSAQIP